jgi:hypothetical protein
MEYEAKNPLHVFGKLNECRFFLGLLAEYRQKIETEGQHRLPTEFLYYASAFLSAFRCAANRLIGVVRHKDHAAGRRVWDQLRSHQDIEFVRDISNLEMHGDGVTIWPRYKVHVPIIPPTPERWSRNVFRFRTTLDKLKNSGVVIQVVDWRFSTRPENVVELCNRALAELEKLIQQELGPLHP